MVCTMIMRAGRANKIIESHNYALHSNHGSCMALFFSSLLKYVFITALNIGGRTRGHWGHVPPYSL